MKITIQNPTQGPLITVSFEDEAATVAQALSLVGASRVASATHTGLTTLRAAAQFAKVAPGVASGGAAGGAGGVGLAGIAGPALLMGMFFGAGDAPPRKADNEDVARTPTLTPNQVRCMTNPYDMSAECAAVRSTLSLLPFSESLFSNPHAARASADERMATSTTAGADAEDLAEPATPATARQAEAQIITEILRAELDEISVRFTFSSTPEWLREKLETRRTQIQLELADAAFAAAGVIAPRKNLVEVTGITNAELKWPGPIPIVVALPADHDPKVVPQEVLQVYQRYARENDHTAVMLLWNPQESRYELERGWPTALTFDSSKRLVRTALPPFLPKVWFSDPGLDLTWYFVPSHKHLNLHEQWGLAPTDPLIIDTLIRGADGEAVVTVQLEALQQESRSSTDNAWRSYAMHFAQTYTGGKIQEARLLIAYEPGSDRRLLIDLQDMMTTPPEGKIVTGFVTPGIDGNLGREGKLSVHLRRDETTGLVRGEFHANLMPPTFNLLIRLEKSWHLISMFMLVEHDGQRTVYQFDSHDLINILQHTPENSPRLGEESHTIVEKTTGKPATVRVVDGQFKSITIDGHTEWYDQPVNRIEFRR